MKVRECRVKSTTEATVDGKAVLKVKAIARYYEDNPDFRAKGECEDTRTPRQKRRQIRREVSKVLVVEKVRGKRQQEALINDALAEWRSSIEDEMSTPNAGRQSMAELVEMYIDVRERLSASANWDVTKTLPGDEKVVTRSTIRNLRATLSYIKKFFPPTPICKLTRDQVIHWEEKMLLDGTSFSGMRKAHVLAKQALNFAVAHGFLKSNVMASLRTPRNVKRANNSLDQSTAQKLTGKLLEMEASDAVTAVTLALHCGLRLGEICGLQWRDVDLDTRHLTVSKSIGVAEGGCYLKSTKTMSGERTLYLDDVVLDVLKRHKAAKLEERDNITVKFDDLFAVGDADGNFRNVNTIGRTLKGLMEALGIVGKTGEIATAHKLRHTFKDALIGGNGIHANAEVTQDCMGHSRKSITEQYGTRNQEQMDEAVKKAGVWLTPTQEVKLEADVLEYRPTGTEG